MALLTLVLVMYVLCVKCIIMSSMEAEMPSLSALYGAATFLLLLASHGGLVHVYVLYNT